MSNKNKTSVNICGLEYKIKWFDKIEIGGDVCSGASNHQKLLILMQKGMPVDYKNDTLLHEILHSIIHSGGIYELFQAAGIKDVKEFEELFVRILTPQLRQALDTLK